MARARRRAKRAGRKEARTTSGRAEASKALKQAFVDNLFYVQGRFMPIATPNDFYMALAYTVRDRILDRWIEASIRYFEKRARTVCYLSAEYLPGPHLGLNLVNLGLYDEARQAMAELGLDLETLLEQEEEPGLGNGGLGRLAACFMDSLATLSVPAIGYGIRYEFGIFDQEIADGWQVEVTDKWLRLGNPWELPRPEIAFDVGIRRANRERRRRARTAPRSVDSRAGGEGGGLRHSDPRLPRRDREPPQALEGGSFRVLRLSGVQRRRLLPRRRAQGELGEHRQGALPQRRAGGGPRAPAFAAVLLRELLAPGHDPDPPADLGERSVAPDEVRGAAQRHPPRARGRRADAAPRRRASDSAGTRPGRSRGGCSAIPTTRSFPRLWKNGRSSSSRGSFPAISRSSTRSTGASSTRCATAFPATKAAVARMSLIDETGGRSVRMAHLATVGSHAVNGVARLHSELLRTSLLSRLPRALAGEVRKQDERGDAAAISRARQPAADEPDLLGNRRRLARAPRPAAGARAPRGRRRVPRSLAPREAREQEGSRARDSSPAAASRSTRRASSTSR